MSINQIAMTFLCVLGSCGAYSQNIFRSVCQGNLSRLDSLIQHESIAVQDDRGRSLLHWAIGCEQKEVFQFLLAEGIDPSLEDHEGSTPMHVAIQVGRLSYLDSLVTLQSNDDWITSYGPSLLERAILRKDPLIVDRLLAKGVDVDAKNERGSVPLEIAKRSKAGEIYQLLLSKGANEDAIRKITPYGEYLGQSPPGLKAALFAPNFISTEESEFGSVFSASGKEFYYGVDVNGKNEIRFTQMVDRKWSEPNIILSHDRYGYNDPFLSNDEKRLYYISKRALDGLGALKDVDIWYSQKEIDGWSEPIHGGKHINSEGNEYYISFTNEGTIYFSSNVKANRDRNEDNYDIYYAKSLDGEFQMPVALGPAINTDGYEADVFVAPDESYLIFCSTRANGFGRGDLYISFKNADGDWMEAVNMGQEINTSYYEYCPFVSKDGKYLFYTSNQDIYWISAAVIHKIKDEIDKQKD